MSLAARTLTAAAAIARRGAFERASVRGRRLGRLLYRVDGRHRGIALANLGRAFPDQEDSWHRATALASFEQAGRTVVEMLWATGMGRDDVAQVLEPGSLEPLREQLARGRGVIMATGHYGNWELIGVAFGLLGIPCVSIARPLDDPDLDAVLTGFRTRTGSEIVPKQNSVRTVLRALRAGKAVAVLMDQNTQRHEAVFAPFFGRQAATPPGVAHLHLRTGAPIVPTFAVPEGSRYRLAVEPPLAAADGADTDRSAAVARVVAEFNARLEERIRRQPAPWLWMHDRWRERPLEEIRT